MVKQTNKAKQHSTPKAVTFPKKNELPAHVHTGIVCTEEMRANVRNGRKLEEGDINTTVPR